MAANLPVVGVGVLYTDTFARGFGEPFVYMESSRDSRLEGGISFLITAVGFFYIFKESREPITVEIKLLCARYEICIRFRDGPGKNSPTPGDIQMNNRSGRFGKLARNIAYFIAGGLCLGASFAARADDMAYMGTSTDEFGTIDLNTGVFSLLGNSGLTLAGMAVDNGMLYGTNYHVANGTLYTINPANGALTAVGSSPITYDLFGSTTTGLYATDTSGNLYSVNAATGATTLIGPTGVAFGSWRGFSTNSSTLYYADGLDLYTINTATGAATLVGPFGDSIEIGALLEENSILYAGEETPSLLVDTLDPATGAATTGPDLTGATGVFYALAPYPIPSPPPSVPEPGTSGLLGTGIAALLL